MEKLNLNKIGKYAAIIALAPLLLVWEVLVWLCKQVVKLDGKLDQPLEQLKDWAGL